MHSIVARERQLLRNKPIPSQHRHEAVVGDGAADAGTASNLPVCREDILYARRKVIELTKGTWIPAGQVING